jgi:hypothetical protein
MKKIIILILGTMVMFAGIAFADEQNISAGVLEGVENATPSNWRSDNLVWKTGIIDGKSAEGMVIDDAGYRWSKYGTNFRGSDGSIQTSGDFNQGMEVTFVLEKDRKTIVTLIRGKIAEADEAEE